MKLLTNSPQVGAELGMHVIEHVSTEDLLEGWICPDEYALLILDISQIHEDKWLDLLKKKDARIPVVGLQGDCNLAEWRTAENSFLEQGGDYLLHIPTSTRELLVRVNASLRRGSSRQATHYFCEKKLAINITESWVRYDGNDVTLAPQERRLFLNLALTVGRPQSLEKLLAALYLIDEADPRIVAVLICRIRRKLRELNPKLSELIVTDCGRGYKLRADV